MKIMHRLTLKSLRMNKSRTVITIVGIALSMALITIIANSTESLRKSLYDFNMRIHGNFDVTLHMEEPTSDNIEKIKLNRNTEEVYLEQLIGAASFDDSTSKFRNYIYMNSYSENYFEKAYDFALEEGHYPQSPDEIVLSKDFVNYSSKEYKVGDKLTLDMGAFHEEYDIEESGEHVDAVRTPDDTYISYNENIKFVKSFRKTYTVVGILEREKNNDNRRMTNHVNIYGYTDLSDNISTAYNGSYCKTVLVKIRDGNQENSISFISDLTGIKYADIYNELYAMSMLYDGPSDTSKKLEECEFHINSIGVNDYLYESVKSYEKTMTVAFYIVLGLTILVMAASVFIIRNSFSISVTEKTVMYGKLSTVGATPKQIRNSIFFEGFILGTVGISIGLLIGIGGSALAVMLGNNLFFELFSGLRIVFSVSWITAAAAVVLGAVTIFLSCLSAAMRASKISPIEAVRSYKQIRIKKNKKNVFKTPGFINKIFGAGGKLAWKNMKRSKRQYRTVVISIVVSVSIFVGVFSFVNYSLSLYNTTLMRYNYNMNLTLDTFKGKGEYMSLEEQEDFFKEIAGYDETDDYSYEFSDYYCDLIYEIPNNKLPKNINNYFLTAAIEPNVKFEYSEDTGFDIIRLDDSKKEWDNTFSSAMLIAFDDSNYNKLLKKLGYSYDEMKDKAILVNINEGYLIPQNEDEEDIHTIKYMEDPVGYTLDMMYYSQDEKTEKYLPELQHLKLEIGGEITDRSEFADWIIRNDLGYGSLVVSKEWLFKNFPNASRLDSGMHIYSSDPVSMEQKLGELEQGIYLDNIAGEAEQMNSVATLAECMVYGIIAVISLIAVTNVFNTVTTNMKFRQKEFAMLRSVGMTKHEFDRMITLECSFYTVKALLIGVITGIIGTVAIHYLFLNMWDAEAMGKPLAFILPWQAILISIIAVAVLVFITAYFSKIKLNKQNIIETIRNDNI